MIFTPRPAAGASADFMDLTRLQRCLISLLLLFSLTTANLTLAAQAAQRDDAPTNGATQSERIDNGVKLNRDSPNRKDQGVTKEDANPKKNNEIFRPSEEISEDFAVSFPVDI